MKGVDPMKANKDGTVTISETDLHALGGLVMRENGEAYKEEDLPVVAEFMQDLVILMFRMGEMTAIEIESIIPVVEALHEQAVKEMISS